MLLAFAAAVLAACSAGGGGNALVPQAFQALRSSQVPEARHRRPARATVYLRIPAGHRHRERDPHYVSPGTASISFAVQPIEASGPSPTPMPVQIFNATVPSPCQKIARSGVLQCVFTVSVMPGRDSFAVTTYPRRNASGKSLSEYSANGVAIPTPDPSGGVAPLAFTLEGVIDHVVLQFPNSVVPADTKEQVGAIPVGVATSAPLDVAPYDAANYRILAQVPARGTPVPYFAPVTLSVTPTGAGVTLKNASGSGNSVTISNPNDLAVTVRYNGAFTASNGAVSSAQSFSIAATGSTLALRARKIDLAAALAATPAPNAAGVALSGNAIPGGTYATTLTSPGPAGVVSIPGSGTMAFSGYGYGPGPVYESILGTATGGVPSASGAVALNLTQTFPDHLGNLWAWDNAADKISCFAPSSFTVPAGSIPAATVVFPGGTVYSFIGFTEDSANDLWFTLYGGQGTGSFQTIGYVPINATSCTAPAPVVYQAAPADFVYTTSLAPIPGTGSVTVGSYDGTVGTGSVLVAATAAPTPNVTTAALGANAFPEVMIGTSTSTYAIVDNNVETLGSISPAGAFSPITTYPSATGSFLTGTTGFGSSATGLLGTTTQTNTYDAGGGYFDLLLNPADGNAATNLQALSLGLKCQGVAFDAQDTAWTFCDNPLGQLQFYHIVPTSTWSVLPGTVIAAKLTGSSAPYSGTAYLGMLEAFGATDGPFKLKHYDTSVVSGVTPVGDRGIALTLTEPNTGSYTTKVDVVDKHGRKVSVTFEIDAIYYAGLRHHPRGRRGYPPVSRN